MNELSPAVLFLPRGATTVHKGHAADLATAVDTAEQRMSEGATGVAILYNGVEYGPSYFDNLRYI